jgi:hypothetical protein
MTEAVLLLVVCQSLRDSTGRCGLNGTPDFKTLSEATRIYNLRSMLRA